MISSDPTEFRFRQGDTDSLLFQKLESLRRAITSTGTTGRTLYVSITDGLPDADPAEPLYTVVLRENVRFGQIIGRAGVPSAIPASIRFQLDGVPNGSINFAAGASEATDALLYHTYPAGSLLEIFAPSQVDHTLDNVSLSIPIAVG